MRPTNLMAGSLKSDAGDYHGVVQAYWANCYMSYGAADKSAATSSAAPAADTTILLR